MHMGIVEAGKHAFSRELNLRDRGVDLFPKLSIRSNFQHSVALHQHSIHHRMKGIERSDAGMTKENHGTKKRSVGSGKP
jgi:hypothetical protein